MLEGANGLFNASRVSFVVCALTRAAAVLESANGLIGLPDGWIISVDALESVSCR